MAKPRVSISDGSNDELAARVLAPLVNSVDTPQLSLSYAAALILIEAMRVAPYKRSESDIISSTTIVLAAALMAIGLVENEFGSKSPDPTDVNDEREGLRAWGHTLRTNGQDAAIMDMARDFFSEVPQPHFGVHIDYNVPSGAELSSGMRLNLAGMGDGTITVPLLLERLVGNSQSGIAERLRQRGIADLTRGLRSGSGGTGRAGGEMPSSAGARRASSPVMMREAVEEELTLDVHQYAAAVATVLRAAIGEFTFAIYGRWGSGKTTLTTVLEPLMAEPGKYQTAVRGSGESFASLQYAVARHNAWKYRTPPEAWIYTYKSLADAAAAQIGTVQRFLLAIRRTVFRRGGWPAAGGLLGLVILLTPLELKLQLAALIASVAGFSLVLHLLSVAASASRRVRELFQEHTQLASHEDKLGMLALIGDDVRSLLLAWVKPKAGAKLVPWSRLWLPASAVAIAGVVWGAGLCGVFAGDWTKGFPRVVPAGWLALVTPSSGATWGDWLLFIGWLLFAIALFVVPWLPVTRTSKRPDRVLLIVDDLDRCQPEEMLNVIEGLKLLLDLPEVAERLQISMLVDEDVLGHAISYRYRAMITERAETAATDMPADSALRRTVAANIIAEQTEKLFACSLRIGPLKSDQLAGLIAKLAGREFAAIRDEPDGSAGLRRTMEIEASIRETGSDGSAAPEPPTNGEIPDDSTGRDDEPTAQPAVAPLLSASDVRFTSSEITVLQKRVPEYFTKLGRVPSPRAVRMLTFKIQLCRFLLQQRNRDPRDWTIEGILDALTSAHAEFNDTEDEAVTIARQVI